MRTPKTTASLNLLPVMNLVTILIPLLLMGAQMMNLVVVDTTLPAICSSGCSDSDPTDEPFNLSVMVSADGLTLQGVDRGLEEPRIPCTDGHCRSLESYDFATLTQRLTLIKDAHPRKAHLILIPSERVSYEVIIGVMDAARETADDRALFPSVTLSGGM
ncbi:MAG: biopolymer transporter ExbD [Myxococcota bacterium]|nr:biopolymer transporter ExbD [Myxococcota bacterium]